mmetsp:Transcript_18545/g.30376  ORF Transcript_18545/g.30376 Transcript_18545/m.30376 type:complete len:107 (+) Transcript_18545:177-497(+)
MAAVPNNNIPTQNTMLPDHFNVFKGGTKFTCDEAVMKEQITTILGPYGVKKLSLGPGAHSNPNENTKQKKLLQPRRVHQIPFDCSRRRERCKKSTWNDRKAMQILG